MPRDHASATRSAVLHRMVMPGHVCPYGLKSKALLEREGYEVDDRPLTTREQTDAFMAEHGVETTPQTFIGDERIGGYDDLRIHFGKEDPGENGTTYRPVIAIFAVAALIALAIGWAGGGPLATVGLVENFIAVAMVLLGLQKLQDVEGFSIMFLNYDLLAQRWVRYGSIYPYAETGAGLLMLAGALTWFSVPVALTIGVIGAASVFKAVYIEKRELKCACVGGGSDVPLGFVSLTENVMMAAMAIWMWAKHWPAFAAWVHGVAT